MREAPIERWARGVKVSETGPTVVETALARDVARNALGRLPLVLAADAEGVPLVRLVVAESIELAEACRRACIPVVRMSGDRTRDIEHISWMIDAPQVVPRLALDERARLIELRADEVAAHIRARSRHPVGKALRKLARGAPSLALSATDEAGVRTAVTRPARRVQSSRPALSGTPSVSVVVPTRDHPQLLRNVLAGLEATQWPALEVVIVDNGSVDDQVLTILRETSHRVESMPIDFSFPRLVNRGATVSTSDVLVFLNDDVELGDPSWLHPLVEAAREPDTGPVGCLLTYPNGTIQHCGMAIGSHGPEHPFRGARPDDVPRAALASGQRTGVTAACLAIRADVFWELGGFDPLFKRDYNDIDLCLRAAERGYRVWFTSQTALVHNESLSRGVTLHPDTVGDWLMMRTRWADVLTHPDRWLPGASG